MTAMREQLEKNYPALARDALAKAAFDLLASSEHDVGGSLSAFLVKVRADTTLLLELIGPRLSDIALEYLKLRKQDMEPGRKLSGGHSNDVLKGQSNIAADTLQSEGQSTVAHGGLNCRADALQPERDGEANPGMPQGHRAAAEPSHLIAGGEGHAPFAQPGQTSDAEPVREPITLIEAGRVLQKARPSGAGAMQPRAFETRAKLRGESWLVSYLIPGGPPVLELRWDDAEAMLPRMFREAAERGTASIILAALIKEKKKHGVVQGNAKIGETLTPAEIASVAENYTPEKIHSKGRALVREFQKKELGNADA